jgi:transcription-repair coupling factor (superfamily II helicase)
VRKIIEMNTSKHGFDKIIACNSLRELSDRFIRREDKLIVHGLDGAARSLVIAAVFEQTECPITVIMSSLREAETCCRDLAFFIGEKKVMMLPPWEIVTTDMFAFQRGTEMSRMEVLHRLVYGSASVVVMPTGSLMQKTVPRDVLESYVEIVSIGDMREREAMISKLTQGGYLRRTLVEEKGEFSVRGDIMDIYPPHALHPYRMEFFGDEVESIRVFDEATQRSIEETSDFTLFPAGELILTEERRERAVRNIRFRSNELELPRTTKEKLSETISSGLAVSINPLFYSLFYCSSENKNSDSHEMGTLFDYLPPKGALVFDDPLTVSNLQEKTENDLDAFLLKAKNRKQFYLEKETSHLTSAEVSGKSQTMLQIHVSGLSMGIENTESRPVRFQIEKDIPALANRKEQWEEGMLLPVAERIRGWLQEGNTVVFVCSGREGMERTQHLLAGYGILSQKGEGTLFDTVDLPSSQGGVILLEGRISDSFHIAGMKFVILSEEAIFGKKALRRPLRQTREGYFLQSFGELSMGDFIVHKEHGIGRYGGLQKLAAGGVENDFLLIEYQGKDRLYIPVDRIAQIQRYIGAQGFAPKIDRLGGTSWETLKEKVKESVREIAEDLVSIYAAREAIERTPYEMPDALYDEFSASFEFEETPDQTRAIEDIHVDMNSTKPMDRLICGDAGFGKTEVAMRAAFRAALSGSQVALLVPTTILAEQHYQTFFRRMKSYPLRIEVLNRFRSKAEQKEIVEGLTKGAVDIVIGTHRLLQKDVRFRKLGLVIIDEEQRFGVSAKESLKKMKKLVDVITLSATPIPRTLHLSLVGIRDLSIINTPPENRLPIKTYVIEFSEEIIKDAIRQELLRGGQIFFLHDRVRSIFTMANFIQKLVPEAHIGVVHGQMKPLEIENAMKRFIRREDEILVSTTIISAGLDIPTANTIIINRADRFGLSQLYQIRGRVGRAKEESFAWLLVPKGAMLSRDAQKRLQVIMDFTEAGSGFRIASNDLDIRGAGNLLGTSQSGHVSAVGYELYTEMMDKAIRDIKGMPAQEDEEIKPEIHLGISAFIPEDYIADEHQRLVAYKKISLAAMDEELQTISDEMRDRFGNLPGEIRNLIDVIHIRNRLQTIKGKKMTYNGKELTLTLEENSPVDPVRIIELYKIKGVRLRPDHTVTAPMPALTAPEILCRASELIEELKKAASHPERNKKW